MGFLFPSQPSYTPPPPPAPAPPPPTDNSAEVQAAEQRQAEAMRLARGRASTILSSDETNRTAAPVQRRILLGE